MNPLILEWSVVWGATSCRQDAGVQRAAPSPEGRGTSPAVPGRFGRRGRKPWRWLEPVCAPSQHLCTGTHNSWIWKYHAIGVEGKEREWTYNHFRSSSSYYHLFGDEFECFIFSHTLVCLSKNRVEWFTTSSMKIQSKWGHSKCSHLHLNDIMVM